MSNHDNALLSHLRPTAWAATGIRRINVSVNACMVEAIDSVIATEKVTLTEAVRRLIAYGHLVYRLVKLEKATLIVRDAEGNERQIVVL
jgi:hypothetical protein